MTEQQTGQPTSLPLDGITVMDLSRALAGPYCTALLGDLGARIIKVESIKGGDSTRTWPPFEGEHSLYFDSTNRNNATSNANNAGCVHPVCDNNDPSTANITSVLVSASNSRTCSRSVRA